MAPNPRLQDERLEELYDLLPELECKGLCWECCDEIEMSVRERARIEQKHGKVHELPNGRCSMLSDDHRCTVHEIRPLLCRMWGLNEMQRCPFGCEPKPRELNKWEFGRFLRAADRIGGMPSKDQKRRWMNKRHPEHPDNVRKKDAA